MKWFINLFFCFACFGNQIQTEKFDNIKKIVCEIDSLKIKIKKGQQTCLDYKVIKKRKTSFINFEEKNGVLYIKSKKCDVEMEVQTNANEVQINAGMLDMQSHIPLNWKINAGVLKFDIVILSSCYINGGTFSGLLTVWETKKIVNISIKVGIFKGILKANNVYSEINGAASGNKKSNVHFHGIWGLGNIEIIKI